MRHLSEKLLQENLKKTSDWDAFAYVLSQAFSKDEKVATLKARGCRERMDRGYRT